MQVLTFPDSLADFTATHVGPSLLVSLHRVSRVFSRGLAENFLAAGGSGLRSGISRLGLVLLQLLVKSQPSVLMLILDSLSNARRNVSIY